MKTRAKRIVNTILDHLRDRSPFKWDLRNMKDDHPGLYEEMVQEMSVAVDKIIKEDEK